MIEKRLSLSETEACERSLAVEQRVFALSRYRTARVVALYSDFKGEVRTGGILRRARTDGKAVALPLLARESATMRFVVIDSEADLVENREGFREPLGGGGLHYDVPDIDLFFVPGVAFDLAGNRLGMGKGYYDRALEGVPPGRIAALAYEFQLLEEVPSFSHDVRVGWIVTEERLIRTAANINNEED